MIEIFYKKLSASAKEPFKKHDDDACYDLYSTTKSETPLYIEYGTDIAFEIPKGWVGLIFPRSSVTGRNLMLKNCVGVIDSGYRDQIIFRFQITSNVEQLRIPFDEYETPNDITIKDYSIGERIGQIMFIELGKYKLMKKEELEESTRGKGGYGSTGTH